MSWNWKAQGERDTVRKEVQRHRTLPAFIRDALVMSLAMDGSRYASVEFRGTVSDYTLKVREYDGKSN